MQLSSKFKNFKKIYFLKFVFFGFVFIIMFVILIHVSAKSLLNNTKNTNSTSTYHSQNNEKITPFPIILSSHKQLDDMNNVWITDSNDGILNLLVKNDTKNKLPYSNIDLINNNFNKPFKFEKNVFKDDKDNYPNYYGYDKIDSLSTKDIISLSFLKSSDSKQNVIGEFRIFNSHTTKLFHNQRWYTNDNDICYIKNDDNTFDYYWFGIFSGYIDLSNLKTNSAFHLNFVGLLPYQFVKNANWTPSYVENLSNQAAPHLVENNFVELSNFLSVDLKSFLITILYRPSEYNDYEKLNTNVFFKFVNLDVNDLTKEISYKANSKIKYSDYKIPFNNSSNVNYDKKLGWQVQTQNGNSNDTIINFYNFSIYQISNSSNSWIINSIQGLYLVKDNTIHYIKGIYKNYDNILFSQIDQKNNSLFVIAQDIKANKIKFFESNNVENGISLNFKSDFTLNNNWIEYLNTTKFNNDVFLVIIDSTLLNKFSIINLNSYSKKVWLKKIFMPIFLSIIGFIILIILFSYVSKFIIINHIKKTYALKSIVHTKSLSFLKNNKKLNINRKFK